MEKIKLPNEEAAEFLTNVKGWACKTCRQFYGDHGGSERAARYCCEKDHACGTEGCEKRAEKPRIYCSSCDEKRDLDRWLALKEIPWDGKTPLCLDDDDKFFFGEDDLQEYLAEGEVKLEDLRLVICEERRPPYFEMYSFLDDHLTEGMESDADWDTIDKVVNDWMKENVPTVWEPGKVRPTLESLKEQLK